MTSSSPWKPRTAFAALFAYDASYSVAAISRAAPPPIGILRLVVCQHPRPGRMNHRPRHRAADPKHPMHDTSSSGQRYSARSTHYRIAYALFPANETPNTHRRTRTHRFVRSSSERKHKRVCEHNKNASLSFPHSRAPPSAQIMDRIRREQGAVCCWFYYETYARLSRFPRETEKQQRTRRSFFLRLSYVAIALPNPTSLGRQQQQPHKKGNSSRDPLTV